MGRALSALAALLEEPCACVLRDSLADNRPGLFRGHDLSHHRAGTSASLQQVEVQE